MPFSAPAFAQSLPTGGQVVAGQATVQSSGMDMTVRQAGTKAIIDWDGFSIARGATVSFENGTDGATLNRVNGTSASVIDGLMKGEGSVYLINRNGIVIGKTGEINVGGRFVGSTQDLDNASFMAGGNLGLSGTSEAPIVNYGKIGSLGGDVALVASKVTNEGEISATKGTVGLLAGYQVLLRDQSQSAGKFSVVVGGAGTSVTNSGAIQAAEAELRAQGGNIYALAGNTGGVINARGVSAKDGRIFLTAEGGEARISGTLTARRADGAGGAIEATAKNVLLDSGATLDAAGTRGGSVLVGGDWQGGTVGSLRVADHDIARADAVVMADTAKIDVSGSAGEGGKAVLWSDNYTNFLGRIAAGGATDGGHVETSSLRVLNALGTVDAKAGSGVSGQWLLDPSDITISTAASSNGSFNGGSPNVFTPAAASSTINNATINSSLSAGTSVTISTASAAGGNGDIIVSAPITKSGGGTATLSLIADRHIQVNGAITSSAGALNVVLNSRASGGAEGYVGGSTAITTNGGYLLVGGGSSASGAAQSSTSNAAYFYGAIETAGGNVTIRGKSAPNYGVVYNSINAGGGDITLIGESSTGGGVVTNGTPQARTSGAGKITITGTTASTGNFGVDFNDGATVVGGTGGVVITGTNTGEAGVFLRSGTFSSTGDMTITGTSTTGRGFVRGNVASVMDISATGALTLEGITGATGKQGLVVDGTAAFKATTTNGLLTIKGTGGNAAYNTSNDYAAAIQLGSNNNATSVVLTAGAGGLSMVGTALGGAGYSIMSPNGGFTTITSAGAINVSGNNTLYAEIDAVQTGGGNSTITNTQGALRWGKFDQQSTAALLRLQANNGAMYLTRGLVSSAGGLDLRATDTISGTTLQAGGDLTIAGATTGGSVTFSGQIDQTGNGVVNINSGRTLSLSTLTTAGKGAIDLVSVGNMSLQTITKKAAATDASTLTVKSNANITTNNVISAESGAGALNVVLNSRSNDAALGYVLVNYAITTRGGDVTIGGGSTAGGAATDSAGYGANINGAITTAGGNVTITGSSTSSLGALVTNVDAGGGNITLTGTSSTGRGLRMQSNGRLVTSGAGKITMTGTSGSGDALSFDTSATVTGGTGGVVMTGTSGGTAGGSGVVLAGGAISATGDVSITGTSSTGYGVYKGGADSSITATGALTIDGKAGTGGYQGIFIDGTNRFDLTTTTGLLTLKGEGGANPGNNLYKSAILFGTNSYSPTVAISAGTGGLNIIANGVGGATLGLTFPRVGYATVTSAGAINVTANKDIFFYGNATQTGGGASTLTTTAGGITWGTFSQNAGNLTVNSAGGISLQQGLTYAAGTLSLTAVNGISTSTLRAGADLTVTGGTQTGSTVTVGAIEQTGNGIISVTSGDGLTFSGQITTKGTGNITLTNGAGDLTLPTITKSDATDASTLTVRAKNNLTIPGNISTTAGALNVLLNSRSTDAATGWVQLSSGVAITTGGGSVTIGGGSAAGGAASGGSTSYVGVDIGGSITTAGGAISILGNAAGNSAVRLMTLNAGGGNITVTGNSSSGHGIATFTNGSVTTGGSGTVTLTGTVTGTGSNTGVSFSDGTTVTGGTGGVTLTGTATDGYGVFMGSGTFTSAGDMSVLGTATTGSGYYRSTTANPTTVGATGALTLYGKTSATGKTGVSVAGSTNFTIRTTTGLLTLKGDGGNAALDSSHYLAAIQLGTVNQATPVTITAGTGGLNIVGNALGNAAYSLMVPNSGVTTITSGNAITISGNKSIDGRITTTQTAGGNSSITSTTGSVAWDSFTQSGAADLLYASGSGTSVTLRQATSAAGKLTITAGSSIGTTTLSAGGDTTLTASNGTISTGTIGQTGNGAIVTTSTGNTTLGAITTAGKGNITVTSGATATLASVTKNTATDASTLTVRADSHVVFSGAITSNAGALNVLLNSRSNDASTGYVELNSTVTTNGGNLTIGGGSAAGGAAVGITTSNVGVKLNGGAVSTGGGNITVTGSAPGTYGILASALSAAGGDITLKGDSNTQIGVSLQSNPQVTTSGAGKITITGTSGSGGYDGININDNATVTGGTGGVFMTGTAVSRAGITFAGGTYSSTGDMVLKGTSTNNIGIWRQNVSSTTDISATGALTLEGKASVTGQQGVLVDGTGAFKLKTITGLLTVYGETGAIVSSNSFPAAVQFGTGNNSLPVTITAGTGGLSVTGTGLSAGSVSIGAGLYVSTNITSGGAINIQGNKNIDWHAAATQTGGTASRIASTDGYVLFKSFITSASDLNISSAGYISILDNIDVGGQVTLRSGVDTYLYGILNANSNIDVVAGTSFTAKAIKQNVDGVISLAAGTTITTAMITQSANKATTVTAGGTFTSDGIKTPGDLTIFANQVVQSTPSSNAPAQWIEQTGSGAMTITTKQNMAMASKIAKTGAGAASLTLKSYGNVDVSSSINATTGKMAVTLQGGADPTASGPTSATVGVSGSGVVNTNGGNFLARGGAGALAAISDPTIAGSNFVATMQATGAVITGIGGRVNTTGGDLELRSVNGFVSIANIGVIGAGNLSIYGLSSSAGAGVEVKDFTLSAESGAVTLFGASTGTGPGVSTSGTGRVTALTTGAINISGSTRGTTSNATRGVVIAGTTGATQSLTGGTITVKGVGGGGAGSYGVLMSSTVTGKDVSITGTATGTGTTNAGISLEAGTSTGLIDATNNITLTGVDNGAGKGIQHSSSSYYRIGTASTAGTAKLKANSMSLGGAGGPVVFAPAGTLLFTALDDGSLTIDQNIFVATNPITSVASGGPAVVQFGDNSASSINFRSVSGYNAFNRSITLGSKGILTLSNAGGGGLSMKEVVLTGEANVTQSVDLTATKLTGRANEVSFGRSGNEIAALGNIDIANGMMLVNTGPLLISGTNRFGTAALRTIGDLTLNAGTTLTATGSDAISPLQLVSGSKFVNNAGANVLTVNSGSRWLVWSQDPSLDTAGGLTAAFVQYGASYGSSGPAGSGNGFLYTVSPTVTVTLTGQYSRVYDGTNTANLAQSNYVLTGLLNGDTGTVYSTATFDTKNVGTGKTITATDLALVARNGVNRIYGYQIAANTITANIGEITARALTANLSGTVSKVYDGATAATTVAGNYQLTGVLSGDTVALSGGTASYDTKNVGFGKTVTVTGLALSGTDAANYSVNATASAQIGVITAKTLTASVSALSKTYDGNIFSNLSAGDITLSGVVAGDTVTNGAGAVATYADKNAGTGKSVTVAGLTLSGADASNYTVANTVSTTNGTILAKALTVSLTGTASKVYDGTRTATLAAGNFALSGLIGGDNAALVAGSGTYDDKNVGTGKTVTVNSLTLSGSDAGNYTLAASVSGNIGTITAKTLTASVTNLTKTYDGSASATLGAGDLSLTGVIGSDAVQLGAGATSVYSDKNAGTGKAVTVSNLTITGSDSANYVLASSTASGLGTILKKALSLSLTGSAAKVYDGSTSATLTNANYSMTGNIGGDTVALVTGTAVYDDRNAGSNKTVSVSGLSLSGVDAGNYSLASAITGTIGTITAKGLTLTAVAGNKVYDGTTASADAVQISGLVAGDTVAATQSFDSKNAGTRALQVDSGYIVSDGNGGANYVVTVGSAAVGTIAQRQLTATANANDKVYDGSTAATGTLTLANVVSGDTVVTSGGQLAFVDRNAGNGKAVTASGWNLSGADAANYTLGTVVNGVANISQATLTLTASADSRIYDGTVASSGVVSQSGLVSGDQLTSATQVFDSKNAGSRALKVNAYAINDGNNGANYHVVLVDNIGTIARKQLTGNLTGTISKIYDGTDTAVLSGSNLSGVVLGDLVSVSNTGATFDSKNAGTGKTVTVSGMVLGGADAGNYLLQSTSASANIGAIVARTVTVGVSGRGAKTYDGSVALSTGQLGSLALTAADGDAATQALLATDGVTLDASGMTGTLADRNAGTGKGVTLAGFLLANNGDGNYVLAPGAVIGLADVAQKALTLTASGETRIYDGTTGSVGTVASSGLIAGDSVTATQRFDNKDAGARRLVVDTYSIVDGNGGANYAVTMVDGAGTIHKRLVSTTLTADNKVYDGTTVATGTFSPLINVVSGDALGFAATLRFDTRDAGTGKVVSASNGALTGTDARNYVLATIADATADVARAALVLHATTQSREYNGLTQSTAAVTATGLMVGDSFSATQSYDTKNAGGRTINVDGNYQILDGNNGRNYTVSLDSAAGVITRRTLAASVTVDTKIYDGTTAATGQFDALMNLIAGDDVTISGGTLTFADRNVGYGKTVNVTGSALGGADAANYVLSSVASGTGAITPKALTLNAVTDTKIYDGTVNSAGIVQANGLVSGDAVIATQTFDAKDAAGRFLQVDTYSVIDGNGGANYTVTLGQLAVGTITPKTLSADVTINNKVYDGTTAATGTINGLNGIIAGDTVAVNLSNGVLAFLNRDAGIGKAVTVGGLTLTGADALNYQLAATANGTADITKATLTLTAATDSKTYDGTLVSTGIVTDSGLVAGDTISGVTQAFDSKNAGNRMLSANAWTIDDGNGGGNYTVVKVDATGTIAQKLLTGQIVGTISKTYDGTDTALLSAANLAGIVAGDVVSVSSSGATYDDKNVGVNKTVTISGLALNGTDAANYALQSTSTQAAVGTILARQIAISTTGSASKVYDGTTALTAAQLGALTFVLADGDTTTQALLASDGVSADLSGVTGTLADRNAGNGKSVTLTGYGLANNSLGNYVLTNGSLQGVADVAKATLTLTAATDSRTYDGTAVSTGIVTDSGLVAGDTITGVTQAFDSKNAGNRVLSANAWTIDDGNGGGNYTVVKVDAAGTIAQKLLTGQIVGTISKTYDGTDTALLSAANLAGIVAGDVVSVSSAGATYDDKNVGVNKIVTISGLALNGTDAANYALQSTSTQAAVGTILARQIAISTTGNASKVYDGTTALTAAQLGALTFVLADGDATTQALLASDGVSTDVSGVTGTFADRNAGNGKSVTLTNYGLTNNSLGNYVLTNGSLQGVADITKATLTLTAAADSRTYDGTAVSTGQVTHTGLVAGDSISGLTQAFDSKNAGNRTLSANAWTISDGNGGGNYTVVKVDAVGTIAQKLLTGQLTGTVTKVYDGTDAATLSGANLSGIISGDDVIVSNTGATFDSKNAGTNKTVSITGMNLSGNDAGNYALQSSSASANIGTIFARTVTIDVAGRGAKTYDGTTVLGTGQLGTLVLTVANADSATQSLMATDGVMLNVSGVTGTLADRNAGTGKGVTLTNYALDGNALGNYVLASSTVGALADVSRATLILTAANENKTYDRTTVSTGSVGIGGLATGDTVTNLAQAFDSRNAGSRALHVTSYTVNDGNGGANYIVQTVDGAGTIALRQLTVAVTADNKVYDGTTAATGTFGSLQNLIGGDNVTATATLSFADRNAGTAKIVTASNAVLGGTDAANYTLAPIVDAVADITKASLVLTAVTDIRQYDGTRTSTGTVSGTGLMTGDSVTATQSFDNKNAGSRALRVDAGYAVNDGNGGNNYVVTLVDASGAITQRVLTTSVTVNTKEYDGTTAATGTFGGLQNVVAGETVTLSGGTMAFVDRNAGVGKAVNVSGATLGGA
ncbi:filamentous hemagglutinin family protein, partial [Sphingobium sp. B1D7B]|uniref:YDG domain-containing protein n=1 Tax=Sphingobium sp. B1D7B TaxID=2940578 RepID=UPI0022251F40